MDFENQTTEFEKWMQSNGIQITNAKLNDYRSQNQGRGLVATAPIAEGDKIISIPQAALITAQSAPELEKLVADLEEWPQLMITMLYVSQKHWEPYFGVLPTEFSTPMFWDSQQLDLLKPSAVVEKIGRQEADELYDSLSSIFKDPLFNGVDTSREAFHRMGSLIMAYGFDVLQGEETIKAMVPPADMLNSHSKYVNARLEMPDEDYGNLEMVAIKDIAAGEQIYNFYGELPNSDLLRRYGYVEAGGNSSDVVEISLEMLLETSEIDEKVVDVWQDYDEAEIIDEAFDIGEQGVPDPDLIAMANLLSMVPSKKTYRQCVEMAEEQQLTDIGRHILLDAVKRRLQEYATVQTQIDQAQHGVYTDIEAMCRQVVGTEKRLLEMCVDWLDDGTKRRRMGA